MKLFKKLGLGLLSLAGIFSLAACNKAAVQEDASTRKNMSSIQTYASNEEINEHIKGKTSPYQAYYFYDLLVNRSSNWKAEVYDVDYGIDEQGEIYGNDTTFPATITFKKGKIYIISAKYYRNYDHNPNNFPNAALYYDDPEAMFSYIYGTTYSELYKKTDFICLDEDGAWKYECDDDQPCDCVYCQIDTNYQHKYREIINLDETYFNKAQFYIVPTIDISLNLSFYGNYPAASMTIYSGDLTPLENVDITAPAIEGENIYINVDNPLSFEQIKTHFSATDETDGDITSRLSFTDNTYILTNGKIACGTYSFKVSVSDNAGNTTTKLYYAHVVDYTDPTIIAKTINVSYTHKLTSNEILNLFEYSDNYTPASQLIFKYTSDNYSDTYQNLGAHTITAKVLDQQGNEASATATVNVIDDVAPFMVVPENLKITTLDDLTLDSFRQYVTVTDEKEGNITNFELTDLDDYLNHKKVAGTYRIKVVASDSVGNTIEKTFSFLNEDKDMPSITIDPDYILIVNKGDVITKEQVINYFVRTGQLTLEEAESVEVESLYFEATPKAGVYSLKLKNDYKVIETKIEVLDDGTSDDPATPTDPKDPIKPADNKFLSTEGYAENFFIPANWSIYHYLTLVGMFLVLVVVIVVVVKKH